MSYLRQHIIQNAAGDLAEVVSPTETAIAWNQKGLRVIIGPTDKISNLPVIIDYDHHQLQEGETWGYTVVNTNLGNNASKDVRLVVPNITIPADNNAVGLCPHFRFEVISAGTGDFYLYEGTTFNANGSQRTPINRERNGTYTSKLQVWEDPTVNAVGTEIFHGMIPANKTSGGGISTTVSEFVLKNNTSYLFRFTSTQAGGNVLMRLFWYEDLGV